MTRAQETVRAETTKSRVTPSTTARSARLSRPSRRPVLCGRPAPRATGSVLFSRTGRGPCRLLFVLLFSRALVPVGGCRGVFGRGLFRCLVAVVGRVETRALERDAHGVENFPDQGPALDAGRKRVFRELLHHVEDVSVFTLVLVDRHPASSLNARGYKLYRLDGTLVLRASYFGPQVGSSSPEPKSCWRCSRAVCTSSGRAQISSTSSREALRLTYSSFTTSPRCALANAVHDVLEHPRFALGRPVRIEQPVPERPLLALRHPSLLARVSLNTK